MYLQQIGENACEEEPVINNRLCLESDVFDDSLNHAAEDLQVVLISTGTASIMSCSFNGWQLAKMKKSIPDMSLPWNL